MPQGLSEASTTLENAIARAQALHDRAGGRKALCFPKSQKFWAVVLQYGDLMICHAGELPTQEEIAGYAPGDFVVLHKTQDTENTWKPSPAFIAHEAYQEATDRCITASRAFQKITRRKNRASADRLMSLRRQWDKSLQHLARWRNEQWRLMETLSALELAEAQQVS